MSEALGGHGVEHHLLAMAGRGHGFDDEEMQHPAVSGVFDQVRLF